MWGARRSAWTKSLAAPRLAVQQNVMHLPGCLVHGKTHVEERQQELGVKIQTSHPSTASRNGSPDQHQGSVQYQHSPAKPTALPRTPDSTGGCFRRPPLGRDSNKRRISMSTGAEKSEGALERAAIVDKEMAISDDSLFSTRRSAMPIGVPKTW